MSLATGGFALGATSTRSRFASLARFSATEVAMTPTCSPLGPIRRTWETRISSLMRGSSLMMTPILMFPQRDHMDGLHESRIHGRTRTAPRAHSEHAYRPAVLRMGGTPTANMHAPGALQPERKGSCLEPEAITGFQVGLPRFLDFSSLVDNTTARDPRVSRYRAAVRGGAWRHTPACRRPRHPRRRADAISLHAHCTALSRPAMPSVFSSSR